MRGAVVTIEQAHRYPGHIKLLLELVAAVAVVVALALLLYDLGRLYFEVLGTSTLINLFPQFLQLRDWIMFVAGRTSPVPLSVATISTPIAVSGEGQYDSLRKV